jgi:hypothetical protein
LFPHDPHAEIRRAAKTGGAKTMIKTLKSIVLPALIGLTLFAVIGLLGSSLIVYRAAADVHPLLGWFVILLMVAAVGLLLVYPLVRVLRLPGTFTRPHETEGPKWEKFVRRYARRLVGNDRLKAN